MDIAKNIHLIFLRRDEEVPRLFRVCERQIHNMHPSWNITLWDESKAQQFLNDYLSEYVPAYTSFSHNIQKADFLRLALVYVFGGFYMDMDMYPVFPVDELTTHSLVLAEEMEVSGDIQKALNLKYPIRVANYMFGGRAGHPFLKYMLDAMSERSVNKITILC